MLYNTQEGEWMKLLTQIICAAHLLTCSHWVRTVGVASAQHHSDLLRRVIVREIVLNLLELAAHEDILLFF